MNLEIFARMMIDITQRIGNRRIDRMLERQLNDEVPADGPWFREVFAACQEGVADGWMCQRSAGGIRYGRVLKPSAELGQFSVDVVEMHDLAGPHHAHPNGEIDLIMPLDATAEFDGRKAGWLVYEPNSAHAPTVMGGRALILYLLPQGAIEFTAHPRG